MAVAFHPLTVTEIERDTSSSVLVTLECPDTELGFEHGQYLTFRREIDGVEIRRSYSICSPVDGALRVGIKRVDGGASTWPRRPCAPATPSRPWRRWGASPTNSIR